MLFESPWCIITKTTLRLSELLGRSLYYFSKSCWSCFGVSPVRLLDSCAAVQSARQLLYTSGQYGGCSLAARSATSSSTTCQRQPHASNRSSRQDGFWCQAAVCLVSRSSFKQLSPPCCTLQFHCQGWKVGTTYLTWWAKLQFWIIMYRTHIFMLHTILQFTLNYSSLHL